MSKFALGLLIIFNFGFIIKVNAQLGFKDFWNAITAPFQPVWGEYFENGPISNRYPPLTTFERNGDFNKKVVKIREKIIKEEHNYHKIYKQIYNNAFSCSDPNDNGCDKSSQAKDAAFVFLVGLNSDGSVLDENSSPTREFFKTKYLELIYNWPAIHDYVGKEKQFTRARENILFIQGFDFLQLGEWTGAGNCKLTASERDMIKETIWEMTFELHSWANNPNGAYGWWPLRPDNNMTLMVAAACGMGAIAAHDRTTYLWCEERKPSRWASSANAYINRVMWHGNNSMSEPDKIPSSGYAEGPQYYRAAFDCLWPYFLSFRNFTASENRRFGPYYKCALCFTGEYINYYFLDKNFLNLNDWYVNIILPNGDAPTIDDTWIGKTFAGAALDGVAEHSIIENPTNDLYQNLNLKADYLARFNIGATRDPGNYFNPNSGDIIVRNEFGNSMKDKHYFHLNAERGAALNGGKPTTLDNWTWGHEHGDVGSFIIAAGEDLLAIDPALFGDENFHNFQINQGIHHNVISVSGEGPEHDDNAIFSDLISPIQEYSLMRVKTHYWNRFLGVKTDYRATIERKVEAIKLRYGMKYVINDIISNEDGTNRTVKFNLNGNGFFYDQFQSFEIVQDHPNSAIWDYPCHKDNYNEDNWKMRLTLTTIDNSQVINSDLQYSGINSHGNNNKLYIQSEDGKDNSRILNGGNICDKIPGENYGTHTRASSGTNLSGNNSLNFIGVVEVYPCNWSWGPPPLQKVTARYNSQVTNENGIFDLHFSRTDELAKLDTSFNPLFLNTSAILETNARAIFFSYSTNTEFKFGNCVSFCNFRKARMDQGRLLRYHDTTYIESTKFMEAFYSLNGKCKYTAYTKTDTACTVRFYLADVEKGVDMKINGLTYS